MAFLFKIDFILFYSSFAKWTMFPNQIQFGKDISIAFKDTNIRSILAVAMTQSGKTGSMLSVIHHMKHQHVFIITGLSSVEWMDQTKQRFPEKYRNNIFHRNQLPSFVKKVKLLTNVLIIIDENQVAFKKGQTIHKSFLEAGIMDDLITRDIRIVHFTATPSNVDDFLKHNFSAVVRMIPDSSYVSAFQLLNDKRILWYKDLCGIDKAREDIKLRILDHSLRLKQFTDNVKANSFIKRKTAVIIKNQLALLKKYNSNLSKLLLRIQKTNDIIKKSEHLLDKLVLAKDIDDVNLLIRENQNVLDNSEKEIIQSEKSILLSTTKLAEAKKDLRDSDRILQKLEQEHSITNEEQLRLVDKSVFDNIREISKFLGDSPKYHIIRTSHSFYHILTILHFKRLFKNADFFSEVDLDLYLSTPPTRHTFLFIKEKLRCAKTLDKDHLGVLYERITDKPQMDTILQGLVGRLTGYHSNLNSVVFSNPDLVLEYNKHWQELFKNQKHSLSLVMLGTSF